MRIEYVLLEDAKPPFKASPEAVGYDLYVREREVKLFKVIYRLGVRIKPPSGYYTELIPRSSVSKTYQVMANSVGIIDPDYRGELALVMYKIPFLSKLYKVGERAAQLILKVKTSTVFVPNTLDSTKRGEGGFGSTGKK